LFTTDELAVIAVIDDEATEAVLKTWDIDVVGEPPVPGGVAIEGTTPVPVYPETGLQVDRTTAAERLLAGILAGAAQPVELDTALSNSRVTRADVDAASPAPVCGCRHPSNWWRKTSRSSSRSPN
jgi:hypothetical protein